MDKKMVLRVEDAVDEYMAFKLKESKDDFLTLMKEMSSTHGQKFKLSDPSSSGLDFLIVRIAIDCINLWSLFPMEIADGILKTIIEKYLGADGMNKRHNIDELFAYMDIMKAGNSTRQTEIQLHKVTERFMKKLLGENIKAFYMGEPQLGAFRNFWSKNKEVISPLYVAQLRSLLLNYSISWRAIGKSATII